MPVDSEMVRLNIFYITGKYCLEDADKGKPVRAKRLPQYAAAFTASISAFAFGTILAWTSPVGPPLLNGSYGFPVSHYEMSLIGSLMPIGAAISSVPTGYLTDRIGRKTTLLSLVPVCILGWGLIMSAVNVEMIYAGRFVLGVFGGAICVASPVFITEMSQKEIRGELSSYFGLLLAAGIVLAFIVGSQLSIFYFTISCAIVPVIYGVALAFFPDTPVYFLTRGRPEEAMKSLRFYRGADYNAERELSELAEGSRKNAGEEESMKEAFLSKQGIRAFFISLGLMAFQQLCGINATTFYSTTIFQDAGSTLKPEYATIIIGFMQFGGTFIAMYLTDRIGRVILLVSSAALMSISMFTMGIYFYMKEHDYYIDNITWLPLFSVCVFTVVFAMGYGPVPWSVMTEIIPSKIVGTISSIACVVNWMSAFLVTKFFSDLVIWLGAGGTFWIFSVIGLSAAIFSFKAIPETKGKSFEEIQREMSR